MKKITCVLLLFILTSQNAFSIENPDDKIFYQTIIKNTNTKGNNSQINIGNTNTIDNTQSINTTLKQSEQIDNNKTKTDIVSIYLGAGLGTTGIDIMGGVYYKNFIGIRGNYSFIPNSVLSILNKAISGASDNIVHATSSFSGGGLDLSIRPFFGAFRIDLGMRIMNYSVSVNAFETINNPWVQNAGVGGGAKFVIADGVKPYLGLGWDWNPFLGFTIGFDVGVIYTGQWKMAKMDANIAYGDMTAEQRAQFDANYGAQIEDAKQTIQDVKNKVNNKIPSFLCFWPVFKLNVGWKFNI